MPNFAYVLTLILLSLLGGRSDAASGAAGVQDLPSIRAAVEAFLADRTGTGGPETAVTLGRLDPRLRLPPCDTPLQASQNPGARPLGASSVNVRCEGSTPWSIFVPVVIRERREAVVTTRALPAGHALTAQDLARAPVWVGDPATQTLEDPNLVIGKQVQRPLAAGAVVPLNGLRSPRLVRRGAPVTLSLARGPIAVRMAGVALQDGAVGERVQARNNASQRIVEGVVEADGTLAVR